MLPLVLPGTLRIGEAAYPVRLRFASKYSLWLQYAGLSPEQATGTFDSLLLETDAYPVETGQCRVIPDVAAQPGEYRVVAMAGMHDFEKLLFRNRIDVLDNTARNLPLILGYKEDIDPRFRECVADIAYELSVYRNLFDDLDSEYAGEPAHVAEVVQQGLIEQFGGELIACLNKHVARTQALASGFTGAQHGQHGYYLRKQLWDSLLSAPFIARTILKPRGYAGDSEMMRMCYRDTYEGDSTFGRILHKYSVSAPAAQAVRNRRRLVPELARVVAERMDGAVDRRFKMLSVACGPAMELEDLFRTVDDCERLHCSLLDQDQLALREAEAMVADVEARLQRTLSVDFVRESVRTLLTNRALRERWGSFHFIYSMGLFDYLNPAVAEAVLKKLYTLLLPGGELAIGNFHVSNPDRHYMEYWLDWPLYYRTEEEFKALAAELPGVDAWVEYDATGVQMLLRIRKAAI